MQKNAALTAKEILLNTNEYIQYRQRNGDGLTKTRGQFLKLSIRGNFPRNLTCEKMPGNSGGIFTHIFFHKLGPFT